MPESQTTHAVFMIRPSAFASNAETLASNRFQHAADASDPGVPARALAEWQTLTEKLRTHGIQVQSFAGRSDGAAPDEIFPNNWVSFHADGSVVLYPMMAASRRLERRTDVLHALEHELGYRIERVVDLTAFEQRNEFLEGTGSLVLDRAHRVAYACLSPRTHPHVLTEFGRRLDYEVVPFAAFDATGAAIYHTNVLLSIGTRFALLCPAAIPDRGERDALLGALRASGREIIEFTPQQLAAFAGNALELAGNTGPVIALSQRAHDALSATQLTALGAYGTLLASDVRTIETYGGGSVRCMLAEVALPRRTGDAP